MTEYVGWIDEFHYWNLTYGQTEYIYTKLNTCQADKLTQLITLVNRVYLLIIQVYHTEGE
jgi:hypothetical protein